MFPELKKGGVICLKIPLLFLGLVLALSAISQAGPGRGGFNGGGFHNGFVARGLHPAAVRGGRFSGGGVQRRFIDHRDGSEFTSLIVGFVGTVLFSFNSLVGRFTGILTPILYPILIWNRIPTLTISMGTIRRRMFGRNQTTAPSRKTRRSS
jgi:hypothetical protein